MTPGLEDDGDEALDRMRDDHAEHRDHDHARTCLFCQQEEREVQRGARHK